MNLDLRKDSSLDYKINKIFQKICLENRNSFNQLIEIYSNQLSDNLDWWVSPPASRHTMNSDLFLDYCKVQLVAHLLNYKQPIKTIVVDSKAMKEVLKQIPLIKKTKIIYLRYTIKTLKNNFIKIIIPLYELLTNIYRLLFFKLISKKILGIDKYPITIIDTFAIPGYYSKDRYYSGLWDSLNKQQKEKIYFCPTLSITKWNKVYFAFNDLIKSDRQFLFKEEYLKISDIFFSVLYFFRIRFLKINKNKVAGIDYSSLIKKDLFKRSGYGLAIGGLINFRFVRRLKLNNIKIDRFIDWWESQPHDKGFHKGINYFYPKVMASGYLGYVPRSLELQLYPTKYEMKYGIIPKKIFVIGKGFIEGLKIFNKDQKVIHAPAFRFQHLWSNESQNLNGENYSILIALTTSFDESIHIISQMIEYVHKKQVKNITFWIKPHPTISFELIKSEFGKEWPGSFNFSSVDTQTILRQSNILISGMSSICLEAMALGIPSLVIDQNKGLSNNPIPSKIKQDLWKKCNSIEDIANGINAFQNRNYEEIARHRNMGADIRNEFFEPVTKTGVANFLERK